ncbi:shikimate dehydrogenase [Herbiconiux sp.]|uniref:shikimate dehydrogenase n=1 Tax=Herbiconiux sp. TaxID=1871186 RepID=UPI0025BE5135|nr:shikimate dehydrogenase [Herbiconiux sp.]
MTAPFSAQDVNRLAVLGSPIAHSKSPLLHETAYAALGLPWEYQRHEIDVERLGGFVAGLGRPWRGLSLTMPLKEAIAGALDSIDAVATASGSVNTVLIDYAPDATRRLSGFNTDVYGMVTALQRADVTAGLSALVVGGGATARSAVVAAAHLGVEHVDIVLRSPAKAASVVAAAHASGLTTSVRALSDPATAELEPGVTISTLPGGAGASAVFAGARAPHTSTLLDVAYHPWPSEFGALWDAAGSTTVSGLAMLVHQAVAQIRVFLNGDPLLPLPDEEAVTRAMLQAAGLES